MAETKTYTVVRPHEGDKEYSVGDTRVADPAEVAHPVPHVLREGGPKTATSPGKATGKAPAKAKAPAKPAGKAEPAALNKVEPILLNKGQG